MPPAERAAAVSWFLASRLALVIASALVAATVNDVVEIGFEHRAWAHDSRVVPDATPEYPPAPAEEIVPAKKPREVNVEILRNGEQMTLHFQTEP